MKFNIKGLVQSSMVDWPGKTCTVLFIGGCNLSCRYCYNNTLNKEPVIEYKAIVDMLEKRKELVQHVILSGGEPLHNDGTLDLITALRGMGYHVGIHTNGIYNIRLNRVIDLIEFVGIDIKTAPSKYSQFFDSFAKVNESLSDILNNNIDYEVRTTMDYKYLAIEDYREIAEYLKLRDIKKWVIKRQRKLNGTKNVMFDINNNLERKIKKICKEFGIIVDIV